MTTSTLHFEELTVESVRASVDLSSSFAPRLITTINTAARAVARALGFEGESASISIGLPSVSDDLGQPGSRHEEILVIGRRARDGQPTWELEFRDVGHRLIGYGEIRPAADA
jgi:hypothetical protein